MTASCTPIDCCIACGSLVLTQVLDLNEQPLANSFKKTKNEQENLYLKYFPNVVVKENL